VEFAPKAANYQPLLVDSHDQSQRIRLVVAQQGAQHTGLGALITVQAARARVTIQLCYEPGDVREVPALRYPDSVIGHDVSLSPVRIKGWTPSSETP
jgi:hypothetical protein